MGQIVKLKCNHCGNIWSHWKGIGFSGKEIKGDKELNKTGDADQTVCCPKCQSEDYEVYGEASSHGDGVIAHWD